MTLSIVGLLSPGYLPGFPPATPLAARHGIPITRAVTMRAESEDPGRPRRRPSWRGIATALALATANVVTPARLLDGPLAGVLGARPAFAAPSVVSTGARKKARLVLKAKLGKVPVFMVTNGGGSPFLNKQSSGDQSAVMFLFPSDAQRMLKAVLKAPNGASSGAKVLPSNLDRAFKLAMLPPSQSGLRDPASGRDLSMSWQFMPHAPEMRAAQALLLKKGKSPIVPKVPCYTVTGLRYKKHGREVQPVFLAKADADAALAQLGGPTPTLEVLDLVEMLQGLLIRLELNEPGIVDVIKELEFVPPTESVDFRADLKNTGPRRAAKIFPPNHNAGR